MAGSEESSAASDYWNREGLAQAILDYLVESGKSLDALTVEDLATVDQFHNGGLQATTELAEMAEISKGAKVLDVGGGLGGPARTLAVKFGCSVTAIDLTETYVQAAKILTERTGLSNQVKHDVGDALDLPYDDGAFDVVWTQQSGMNIRDKKGMYQEFYRVLAPGGTLAFQEFVAGPVQPIIFPALWARDSTTNFLLTPNDLRDLIESVGFIAGVYSEISANPSTPGSPPPPMHIAALIMGDELPAIQATGRRNTEERRTARVRSVYKRP